MFAPEESQLRAELAGIAASNSWFMAALRAVRNLELSTWCIGAGAVRSMVWDSLHGFGKPSELPDVDVAYFDERDLSPQRERILQQALALCMPGVPWEVTNQAGVHLWFESKFGYPVSPLGSLEDGLASWPEYATCVGITLGADDTLSVIAPHGLADLFAMVVRHNPARASVAAYRQRLAAKRFAERWPKVTVVPS